MNNPTKKTQKPRTGAGSLERKRDRFTEKMNQVHGVRGYASMREAMDAKYGYIPEDELQLRVARLTNHLIERYSHYTVDEIRSVAAQAAIDPNHPALQKYWDEIEAGSNPDPLAFVGADTSLLSVSGEESFLPSKEVVESQANDSDASGDDVVHNASADVTCERVNEVETIVPSTVGASEPVVYSLVPSFSEIEQDERSISSSDSYASAIDADVPALVCAEVHQIDVNYVPAADSDANPSVSGRDAFPRSYPIRPLRTKRLASRAIGGVRVSVAPVIATDVMRRVADIPVGTFALDPFPPLDSSYRAQYPNLYRRESCLRQRVVRWCVAVATIVMVTTGGLCSLF